MFTVGDSARLLEFLGAWVGDCTKVPAPELRHSVAHYSRRLLEVSVGATRDRFEDALDILKNDVRFRVRRAARWKQGVTM